ncbi:SRPBCC family protein [Oceanobacter mangrovi]|uniref:SRPBCC family protein n=1 Tax=Oceanobacter mangrovi TaxID=2862510 RepID=UPI001C8DFB94|nr:SRPBCC family protein [Oceanobacter mangrovi]
MNKTTGWMVLAGSVVLASCASKPDYNGPATVTQSVMVDAPAAQVWQLVGDFNDLEKWNQAITISKQVSDVRYLTLADGGEIVEQLGSMDDAGMIYSYRILHSPLPVSSYEGTLRVIAKGDNQSEVVWSSTFMPKGATTEEAEQLISGIYQAGLQQLQGMY